MSYLQKMATKKFKPNFAKEDLIRAIVERTPIPMIRLEIAVTNSCTLACDYCTELTLERATIPKDRVFTLVDEASTLGLEFISLTGGEITILDYLPGLVTHIKNRNIITKATTNGYGKNAEDKNYVKSLLEAGLNSITVSYYSVNPKLYDMVSEKKDVKKKVEMFMQMLQQFRSEGFNFFWNVNTLVDRLNYRELPEKLELFARFSGIDRAMPLVVKRRKDRFLSREDIDIYYSEVLPGVEAKCLEERFPIMYREARRLFGLTEDERQRAVQGLYWIVDTERCYHNFNRLFIANNGNAYPCFAFHVHQGQALGNIYELSLRKIWDRQREFIRTINPSIHPICQTHRCNPDITAYNNQVQGGIRRKND
jgi:radical SAM protein with 4Fe4S-binding SPASM domain